MEELREKPRTLGDEEGVEDVVEYDGEGRRHVSSDMFNFPSLLISPFLRFRETQPSFVTELELTVILEKIWWNFQNVDPLYRCSLCVHGGRGIIQNYI